MILISFARFIVGVYLWFVCVSLIEFIDFHDIWTIVFGLCLILPGIWLFRRLGRLKEKKIYSVEQKEYSLVMVSNQLSDEMDEEEYESYVHPFENFMETCWDTGKINSDYEFTLEFWNRQENFPIVTHDPTFMVTTGHPDAKFEKKMQNPFVVTTNPVEVLQFLESHK